MVTGTYVGYCATERMLMRQTLKHNRLSFGMLIMKDLVRSLLHTRVTYPSSSKTSIDIMSPV